MELKPLQGGQVDIRVGLTSNKTPMTLINGGKLQSYNVIPAAPPVGGRKVVVIVITNT